MITCEKKLIPAANDGPPEEKMPRVIGQNKGKAWIDIRLTPGSIDFVDVFLVLKDTCEDDMVLIREPLREPHSFSLWLVVGEELEKLPDRFGGWELNPNNGTIFMRESADTTMGTPRTFCVYAGQWGYFEILQNNCSPAQYLGELCNTIKVELPDDCWDAESFARILSRLIKAEEQAKISDDTLAMIVANIANLLELNEAENSLAALAKSRESTISSHAQRVVARLHKIWDKLAETLGPDKIQLPKKYLRPLD